MGRMLETKINFKKNCIWLNFMCHSVFRQQQQHHIHNKQQECINNNIKLFIQILKEAVKLKQIII